MKSKLAVMFLLFGFVIVLIIGVMNNGGFTQTDASVASTGNSEITDNNAVLDETVFPKDKVVDVKITMDDNDFQDLINNATDEEFKTASVEYNGIKLDNIGIRAKGNLSLQSVSRTDSERYSFKLSFDEYIDNQTLSGLTKINLNNMYSDASYLREFLTYELAEELGLPTPKYSYVNIYVNDELWGFYLAVEQIEDAYLERNFENTTGELYKAEMNGSGSDLTWLGEDISSYSSLVEKSKSSDNDGLINMLDELNNGTDYAKVLDVEEALGYVALNVLTANMDSYLGQNKHNYYLYEDDGVFSILPWDYNMAFGGLGGSNILIDEPTQGALSERPLIAKLLQVEEYKATYHEMLSEAIEGYLSDAQLQTRVQELTQLIDPYVKADPSAFSTYEQYEQGVTQLLSFNTSNVQTIAQQLDGTIPSSGDGSGSGDSRGGAMGGQRENNVQGNEANAAQGQPEADSQNTATPAQAEQSPDVQTDPNQAKGQQQPNDQQNGAPPFDQGRQGGPPNGMGGMGGDMNATTAQGSMTELITTGTSLVVLLLAGLFITFFKRKR